MKRNRASRHYTKRKSCSKVEKVQKAKFSSACWQGACLSKTEYSLHLVHCNGVIEKPQARSLTTATSTRSMIDASLSRSSLVLATLGHSFTILLLNCLSPLPLKIEWQSNSSIMDRVAKGRRKVSCQQAASQARICRALKWSFRRQLDRQWLRQRQEPRRNAFGGEAWRWCQHGKQCLTNHTHW